MKRLNKINTAAALMMGLMALSSCTDGQDWSVDSAFDRLFGTQDITVTPFDTKAAVAFGKTPNTTSYQVEVSTDSLYLDDVSSTSIVQTFTSSPDTIRGLMGETKYYLRMRSLADGKNPSRWVYYESTSGNHYFTTKAEQIFHEVTADDYDESNITVSWDASKEVTSLVLLQGDNTVQTVALTDEQKAAGTYTFTGLNPTTTYVIEIYNGTSRRGSLTVTTAAAMPAASYRYTLPESTTTISQQLIDELAATAKERAGSETNYSLTIGIPAGMTVDLVGTDAETGDPAAIKLPDGMTINFFGLSGGDVPVINIPKALNMAGTHSAITFEHLKLVDKGSNYLINQSAACTVDEVKFTDCEGTGFKNAFFRLQGSESKVINKLKIDNCIFHDMCAGYSFIHVDASKGAGVVKNISISNTTIYNVAVTGKMFIYSRNTDMESIAIDHLTMYNSIGNNQYLIDFDKNGQGAKSLTISNSLFTKSADGAVANKGIRQSGTTTYDNVYYTSDFVMPLSGASAFDGTADDVFTDPANGNFTLKGSIIRLGVGDSRWIPTE